MVTPIVGISACEGALTFMNGRSGWVNSGSACGTSFGGADVRERSLARLGEWALMLVDNCLSLQRWCESALMLVNRRTLIDGRLGWQTGMNQYRVRLCTACASRAPY